MLLEHLLTPKWLQSSGQQGEDRIAGTVYPAAAMSGLTPARRLALLGLDGQLSTYPAGTATVDVVRFESTPVMTLEQPVPHDTAERPWPSYTGGRLNDGQIPAWELRATRPQEGATIVRIDASGGETQLSSYGGSHLGWFNAPGYQPPGLAGPRAIWQGMELPASYTFDLTHLDLVWAGPNPPAGFAATPRPMVHSRRVPASQCQVSEVLMTAVWRGVAVRIMSSDQEQALVQYLDPTMTVMRELGASALDLALVENVVPKAELQDIQAVRAEARA